MWVRRRIDIGWIDIACGAWYCIRPRADAATQIEQEWAGDADALVCLSVRTGFDLLLRSLALPPGSEVLMSALNIAGMFRIVVENGLTPVPLDIDSHTLRPSLDAMREAITPRTRLLVVAHLFGARLDLEDLRALAQERGILVVEDRAQAFAGVPDALPPGCDAALVSFGAIKTATALGGAVVSVRNGRLAARMRALATDYPRQQRHRYLLRLAKYAVLKALSYRWCFAILVKVVSAVGRDYDTWIQAKVHGFDAARLLEQIRMRPCQPLVALLARRLRCFDAGQTAHQRRRGAQLAAGLPAIGTQVAAHDFDLFAIRAADPPRILTALRRAGFDAGMRGSLVVLAAPADRPDLDPEQARRLLREAVFLPLYAAVPDSEVRRMATVAQQSMQVASDAG